MAYIGDGRRKGRILAYRGFFYHKNQASDDCIYWRCSVKNCRAPLKTVVLDIDNPPNNIIVLEAVADDQHYGHFPDIEAVERLKITNIMKSKVTANPSAPIKRTYDDAVANLQHLPAPPDPEDVPLFDDIYQALKRKKRENVPMIPRTVADVVINGVWAET